MTNAIAKINMIKQQLRTGDIQDERILDLFATLPREAFVPEAYQEFAYSDMQIPLAHGQRMMSPLEEAKLLQALNLQGHERVLEIGTGSGFVTAALSRLAAKVISVEYYPDLMDSASKRLAQFHCDNVELHVADGSRGYMEKAPYDCLIIHAAIDALDEGLRLQTNPGGQIFCLLGKDPVQKAMRYQLDHQGQSTGTLVFETNLPALIAKLKTTSFVF